jgi:dienelactone hydrolase
MRCAQGYAGKTAVLGISLGAQTAALAAFKRVPVDAVVLVDGAPTAAETSQTPHPSI